MKIVFLSNSTTLKTGFGKQVHLLSAELKKRGHDITVICGAQNGTPTVDEISFAGLPLDAIDRELHRLSPDAVIVLEGSHYEYLSVNLKATGRTKFFWWFAHEGSYVPIAERNYFRNVPDNRVVFLSKFHQELFSKYVKGPVIPHAVDLDIWYPRNLLRKKIIGNINRNDPRKRWDVFFNIASWLSEKDKELRFHVHSSKDGYFNFDDLEEAFNLKGKVTYTDSLSETELAEMVSQWHCRIDTSGGEGFGVTAIEVAATKTPQIVAGNTTMSEVVPNAPEASCNWQWDGRGLLRFPDPQSIYEMYDWHFPSEQEINDDYYHVRESYSPARVADMWLALIENTEKIDVPFSFNSPINRKSLEGLVKLVSQIGGKTVDFWPVNSLVFESLLQNGIEITAFSNRDFGERLNHYRTTYSEIWPEAHTLIATDSHWDFIQDNPEAIVTQVAKYETVLIKRDGLPPWGMNDFDLFGKGLLPFKRNHDAELMFRNRYDFPWQIWEKNPRKYQIG